MFRYHVKRASSYWKIPKRICNSKSIVNIQNDDDFRLLWLILAHVDELNLHRESESQNERKNSWFQSGWFTISSKKENLRTFEQMNELQMEHFEFWLHCSSISPKYFNRNRYEKLLDLLLYGKDYGLINCSLNVSGKNEN